MRAEYYDTMFALTLRYIYIFGVFAIGSDPLVRIHHGMLRGSWEVSEKGRSYASFKGIPYAAPPTGENRFKDPQPAMPWPDVLNVTNYSQVCLQYRPFETIEVIGDEDCLYINVFTPRLDENSAMPVIAYIHGGFFILGGANPQDPAHLMDLDVVYVTLNYRLGILGFLSTGDYVVPGNAGLKDQSFALHWIKDNISKFGGDPKAVTLVGSSAGAISVHFHYLSTLSKGTFARGMAFSGTVIIPKYFNRNLTKSTESVAITLNCTTSTSKTLVQCLRNKPADVLVRSQRNFLSKDWHLLSLPFLPTIESPEVKNPFLTQCPYELLKSGNILQLPFIIMVTDDEALVEVGAYFNEPKYLVNLQSQWEEGFSQLFRYEYLPPDLKKDLSTKIKRYYFQDKPVTEENFANLIEAQSDRIFIAGAREVAQLHAKYSKQPVYIYRYYYRGPYTSYVSKKNNNFRAAHSDDIIHVFKRYNLNVESPEDQKMSDVLTHMTYSFVATGIPQFPNGIKWLPVKPGSSELNYLNISSATKMEMTSSSDFGRKKFWDSLGLDKCR